MENPIDFDNDGKVTKADAVAFYKQFPFWAGAILGIALYQTVKWVAGF